MKDGGSARPPRHRPAKLHADKAYDSHRSRLACHRRRVRPRIARRGIDRSDKLGRHHRVIDRTLALTLNRLNRFRRLDIHYAFTTFPRFPSCLNVLQGRF